MTPTMQNLVAGTPVRILKAGALPVGSVGISHGPKKGFQDCVQVSATQDSRKFFYAPEELELAV